LSPRIAQVSLRELWTWLLKRGHTIDVNGNRKAVTQDQVHRALRVRAAMHGRSTEAEVRDILESVVKPEQRLRMGDALAEAGRRLGLSNDDFAVFAEVRDKAPAEPMRFE
jgi:plasmid stability protein